MKRYDIIIYKINYSDFYQLYIYTKLTAHRPKNPAPFPQISRLYIYI